MQATITYLLTEQAQRAQMAATGQPVARKQTMTVEVAAEDLVLCTVADDGTATIEPLRSDHRPALLAAGWSDDSMLSATTYAPDVIADIKRGNALLAGAYAGAIAATERYIAATPALSMESPDHSYRIAVPFTALPKSPILHLHPRIENKWDSYGIYSTAIDETTQQLLRARAQAQRAEWLMESGAAIDTFLADLAARTHPSYKRATITIGANVPIGERHPRYGDLWTEAASRNAADEAAKNVAEAAKEQLKQDYIDAWIAKSGDAELQQQHADQLLCRKTVLALIAKEAFGDYAAIPDPPRCRNSDCPCTDGFIECLPRKVYPAWKAIEQALPGIEAKFSKVRDCLRGDEENGYGYDGETAGPVYYTADLTLQVGPFQMERKVKLG